jgi:hypothetical protein
MSCARTIPLIALAVTLAGCAVPSTNFSKDPATQQALVKCRAQASAQPAASPNPFAVTADQNQYVIDCMKAAGYNMQ